MKIKEWTLVQLKQALDKDLLACQTSFEKSICKAVGGREIREMAEKLQTKRKLTPGEQAIAEQFGFKITEGIK